MTAIEALDVDGALPMNEQAELDDPITVSLGSTTNARAMLNKQARIAREDDTAPERWAAFRAVSTERQKTNIMVRTREEAGSLFLFLKFALRHVRSQNTGESLKRVKETTRDELARRGLDVNRDASPPEVTEIPGAGGEPPEDPPYEVGDVVKVKGGHLGWTEQYNPTDKDDPGFDEIEQRPSTKLRDVEVEAIGAEQLLVSTSQKMKWIPFGHVEAVNRERMARRELTEEIAEKRRAADFEALSEVVREHLRDVADEVWGDTIPIDEVDITFNPRYTWIGGRYEWKMSNPGPKIQLSKQAYVSRGLAYLLSIARHELIHTWQDFHSDINPHNGSTTHGQDFKQWIDPLDTHRYCNY